MRTRIVEVEGIQFVSVGAGWRSRMKSEGDDSVGLKTVSIALGAGMFFMGTLIGTLLAMSAKSLTQAVIAALFALFGGSLIAFLQKLSVCDQFKAGIGIFAISLGILIGIYTGLYVNDHQLLTPAIRRLRANVATSETSTCDVKYLRANVIPDAKAIDQEYRNGLKAEEAYEKLYALLDQKSQ
jgi:hypothetical protein